jgi:hypothetical protein
MLVGLGPGQSEHKDYLPPIYKGRIVRYDGKYKEGHRWMVRYKQFIEDDTQWQVSGFFEQDMVRLPEDGTWDTEAL